MSLLCNNISAASIFSVIVAAIQVI